MNINNNQTAPQKEYSYLIYIAACLGVPLLITFIIANVPLVAEKVAFITVMSFAFCSLAWVVGRKYSLNYPLRCILGGAAYILPELIRQIGQAATRESMIMGTLTIVIAVILTIIGTFLAGFVLFAVSYPFQRLFFKLRS